MKGQTAVVSAEIKTVNPFGDISFMIFNPLGYDDVFNIGKPEFSYGASFGCSDTTKWEPIMHRSLSGKSVGYVNYDLPYAVNIDMDRDISNLDNKISIKFPLTAMEGYTEGQYVFTVAMKVGIDDIITVTQDIIVTETVHEPAVGSGEISLGTPALLGTAYAGGTAAFGIQITVPAGKSFELKISGSLSNADIKPSGFAIISPGVCSGFLQEAIFENSLDSTFGTITNADSSDSVVEFMVVLELTDSASGSISETITIDGVSATLNGGITAAPAEVGDLTGTGTVLGPSTIMSGFAAGIRSEVVIPASFLNQPLTFQAYPEHTSSYNIRLCKVEVEHVGLGHPCTVPFEDKSFAETHATFYKSVETKYDDSVTIDLGKTCPISVADNTKVNSSLVFSFYFEIPLDWTVSAGEDVVFNGGLYVDDTALWTTLYETKTEKNSEFSEILAWDPSQTLVEPYVTARIINDEDVHVSGMLGIRFVIKLNKFTTGKIHFEVNVENGGKLCSLKVKRVGKNLGCIKSPEELSRNHIFSDGSRTDKASVFQLETIMNYGNTDLQSNMYADDNSIEILAFIRTFVSTSDSIDVEATLNGEKKDISIPLSRPKLSPTEDFDFEFMTLQGDKIDEISVPLFEAKTIVMEVTVPKHQKEALYILLYSLDEDISEKITFCGLHVTKVGKNLPCLSNFETNTPENKQFYTDKFAPKANFGKMSMYMYIDVCHIDYSSDPQDDMFHVEVTFRPTKEAQDGDIVNLRGLIKNYPDETKEAFQKISITLSKQISPSNVLLSNISFPQVKENTTLVKNLEGLNGISTSSSTIN